VTHVNTHARDRLAARQAAALAHAQHSGGGCAFALRPSHPSQGGMQQAPTRYYTRAYATSAAQRARCTRGRAKEGVLQRCVRRRCSQRQARLRRSMPKRLRATLALAAAPSRHCKKQQHPEPATTHEAPRSPFGAVLRRAPGPAGRPGWRCAFHGRCQGAAVQRQAAPGSALPVHDDAPCALAAHSAEPSRSSKSATPAARHRATAGSSGKSAPGLRPGWPPPWADQAS
jgi:hypothetical protein